MKQIYAGLMVALTAWALPAAACPEYLQGEYRKLNSTKTVDMCELTRDKVVLVVNTASHCGFTGQLKGLEALHQEFADKGLVVVGFPSNDFKQEAESEEKAAKVCFANNGVSFTMLAPSSVKGADANKVFQQLAQQTQAPSWNFNKYLIKRNGEVARHFGSKTKPSATELREEITQLLAD